MPIYEYNCKKCHKHFEMVQKITDPSGAKCPACGELAKRMISRSSFSLKGGGWYKDGYASTKDGGGNSKCSGCSSKSSKDPKK